MLRELSGPGYELAAMNAALLLAATELIERYADQQIGVTDASIVALAQQYRTDRVLTLDRRHFDVLRTAEGKLFDLIP